MHKNIVGMFAAAAALGLMLGAAQARGAGIAHGRPVADAKAASPSDPDVTGAIKSAKKKDPDITGSIRKPAKPKAP